jgi:hypothetical protein
LDLSTEFVCQFIRLETIELTEGGFLHDVANKGVQLMFSGICAALSEVATYA